MKHILSLAFVLFLTVSASGGEWYATIAAIAAVHKNTEVKTPVKPQVDDDTGDCKDGQCSVKSNTKSPPARWRLWR